VQGLSAAPDGSARLISDEVRALLNDRIEMTVLMGANLANEVADDQFCEATIGGWWSGPRMQPRSRCPGARRLETGRQLKRLFHSANFRVSVVQDAETVEVCGALKNVVACGAGFGDGLGLADTTKSAVIRIGLVEMIRFIKRFFKHTRLPTFLESCGVADLATTCYGGRNRRCAEVVARTGKVWSWCVSLQGCTCSPQTMEEVERELLGGQRLQGPATAAQAFRMIQAAGLEDE